jgi:glycosyltransferase involved in cell wall biosynthesis
LFVNHTAGISGPTHSLMMLVPYIRQHYDIGVFLHEEGYLSEWLKKEGIPVFLISELHLRSVYTIYQLLRKERFDLVYGNNPSSYSRRALLAARLAGIPYVWHFRGVKWHWTWRKGIFLKLVNRVVAVSNACAQSLARFYSLQNIRIIYNGVEIPDFLQDRETCRRYLLDQIGLPEGVKILLSVSHIKPRKGQEEAIAVMEQLRKRYDDVHLVIAGSLDRDPPYTARIRSLIQQKNLGHYIHLLGMRDDIAKLLCGADIFLHTASTDAHPRAVLEAMAAGLPVVSFGVDGVAETVVDGETGCLIPFGDYASMAKRVSWLLEDTSVAAKFGQQGRLRIEKEFSAASTAEKVDRIITEVL